MKIVLREAIGYMTASAIALGVDVCILAVLVQVFHWGTLTAATTSFLAGACVAYALSVRFVFKQHRLRNRRAEFAGFVAIGAIGVVVNAAVIYMAADVFGLHFLVAKGIAAGFTFSCNFVARRQILFVPRA
ncbi:MAG: GtrA family protein [Steroidobacterales bacterium]